MGLWIIWASRAQFFTKRVSLTRVACFSILGKRRFLLPKMDGDGVSFPEEKNDGLGRGGSNQHQAGITELCRRVFSLFEKKKKNTDHPVQLRTEIHILHSNRK